MTLTDHWGISYPVLVSLLGVIIVMALRATLSLEGAHVQNWVLLLLGF